MKIRIETRIQKVVKGILDILFNKIFLDKQVKKSG